ncbi:MAG: DUF3152 domain-containing protein [Jiangellaceae bacterium]
MSRVVRAAVGLAMLVVLLGCDATAVPRRAAAPTGTTAAQGEMPGLARPSFTAPATATGTATPTPSAVEIPVEGTGRFAVAPGESAQSGPGRLLRYTVEVEEGLPYDPVEIATVVDSTLADPRGWTAAGGHAFQRTSADGDVRVLLATPATTDELCAPLRTRGEVSCRNGDLVVINARRWAYGVEAYRGDVEGYRQYVVNHEMGHAVGFGHTGCSGPGELAPVMHQQTFGLDGCLPNPWPHP